MEAAQRQRPPGGERAIPNYKFCYGKRVGV